MKKIISVNSSTDFSTTPSFSCCFPSPAWDPSHRSQSFSNCSSIGPFHGLRLFKSCSSMGPSHGEQSFGKRLLECGPPAGPQILLENQLLSPLPGPQCLPVDHPGVESSTGHRASTHITMVFLTGCKGISALVCGAPPLPPSLTLVVCKIIAHFSHSTFTQLLHRVFILSYMLSQRHHQRCWWAQLWAAVSWRWLELTLMDQGEPPCFFTEANPAAFPLPNPCHVNWIQANRRYLVRAWE